MQKDFWHDKLWRICTSLLIKELYPGAFIAPGSYYKTFRLCLNGTWVGSFYKNLIDV